MSTARRLIPKKDTTRKCDSYQGKIQNITSNNKEKQNVTSEHNRHLEKAELARKQMNSDLKIAAVTENVETLTFDMQKPLPLPRLSTNIIFYKRQLWLYNTINQCLIFGSRDMQAGEHKKKENPVKVEVMQKEDSVNTSSIEKDITNRKKTTNDSK
ncbi:hypothetical protein ILUMI_14770, partial [Ignelater luminosus]